MVTLYTGITILVTLLRNMFQSLPPRKSVKSQKKSKWIFSKPIVKSICEIAKSK